MLMFRVYLAIVSIVYFMLLSSALSKLSMVNFYDNTFLHIAIIVISMNLIALIFGIFKPRIFIKWLESICNDR